jgi:uncharacterized protein (TIGR02145 family)
MKKIFCLSFAALILIGCNRNTVSEEYVTIGDQKWMRKNLNVSTFQNGDRILEVNTIHDWEKANENKQPAWCYYNNDRAYGEKYGKLYNWYAVNDPRGLAPEGWHIPKTSEWETLIKYLGDGIDINNGGFDLAATKMISKEDWLSGDLIAISNNSSKFSALPGGFLISPDIFDDETRFREVNKQTAWWTSSNQTDGFADCILMSTKAYSSYFPEQINCGDGLSIRCIKN